MGWIYVLSNKWMPGIYKIGYSDRTVEDRIREISGGTGVPGAFEKALSFEVADGQAVEARVHKELASYRIDKNREFFKAELDVIMEALSFLFHEYSTQAQKLKEYIQQTGGVYFNHKQNYEGFLNGCQQIVKENGYDLERFGDIYKKEDLYFWAICSTPICTEEEYREWVASKIEVG